MDAVWHDEATGLGIGLAAVAVCTSAALVYRHAAVLAVLPASSPKHQQTTLTLRILLMVPVYAIASAASLAWVDAAPAIDVARDVYEAYVIFAFLTLALSLGGGEGDVVGLLAGTKGAHSFPLNVVFGPEFAYTADVVLRIERAVLQYVVVKPAMAAVAAAAAVGGVYEEGVWAWDSVWTWTTVVNNISVTVAMYGLLYLYFGLRHPLHHLGLTPKLMCIKAALVLAFYQSVLISILAHFDLLPHSAAYTVAVVETGLQDLLMCAEMVAAAFADRYAYPVPPVRGRQPAASFSASLAALYTALTTAFILPALRDVFITGRGVCGTARSPKKSQ